ncbi:MAG: glycosyltransferase involved in cell wall biosynthesis [Psychroserpens sp.]|jgi:glycosyltransferase involved in cell wall biosynthesis
MKVTIPKVLFVVFYGQSFTGGPRVLVNLINGLSSDVQPIVLTNKNSTMTEELEKLNLKQIITLSQPSNRFTWLLAAYRKIISTTKRDQVSVYWCRNLKTVLLMMIPKIICKKPLIWDIGMEKPAKGFYLPLHLIGLSIATQIVVEGESVPSKIFPRSVLRQFKHKITVINSAISEVRRLQLVEIRKNRKFIDTPHRMLFVGSLIDRKNPILILRAVKTLQEQHFEFETVLVGSDKYEPEYAEKLRKYVAKHNLKNIIFKGWCDSVPELMASSSMLLMPSKNEGVPYVILESMFCGLPVIGSNAGGIADVITDNLSGQILGNVEDDQILTEKCKNYLNNPDFCKAISENAFKYVMENHLEKSWIRNYKTAFNKHAGIVKNS